MYKGKRPKQFKEKKCRKAKWLSEEALKIANKRGARGKGKKGRYTH